MLLRNTKTCLRFLIESRIAWRCNVDWWAQLRFIDRLTLDPAYFPLGVTHHRPTGQIELSLPEGSAVSTIARVCANTTRYTYQPQSSMSNQGNNYYSMPTILSLSHADDKKANGHLGL